MGEVSASERAGVCDAPQQLRLSLPAPRRRLWSSAALTAAAPAHAPLRIDDAHSGSHAHRSRSDQQPITPPTHSGPHDLITAPPSLTPQTTPPPPALSETLSSRQSPLRRLHSRSAAAAVTSSSDSAHPRGRPPSALTSQATALRCSGGGSWVVTCAMRAWDGCDDG